MTPHMHAQSPKIWLTNFTAPKYEEGGEGWKEGGRGTGKGWEEGEEGQEGVIKVEQRRTESGKLGGGA